VRAASSFAWRQVPIWIKLRMNSCIAGETAWQQLKLVAVTNYAATPRILLFSFAWFRDSGTTLFNRGSSSGGRVKTCFKWFVHCYFRLTQKHCRISPVSVRVRIMQQYRATQPSRGCWI
jgi:hypothetical protein